MKFVNKVNTQKIKAIRLNKINKLTVRITALSKYINCDEILNCEYDLLFFSNQSINNINLYQQLKKNNKNISLNFCEDGLGTYSKHLEEFYIKNTKGLLNYIQKNNLLTNANELYAFDDKFFMWKPKQKIVLIPVIKNDEMLDIYNKVFDYNDNLLPKDCQTIFFEEDILAMEKMLMI